jgi:hypothetical protein
METLSPVLECPPTNVFRFDITRQREKRSLHRPLQYDNVDSAYLCSHTSCAPQNAWPSITPSDDTLSRAELFNKVNVCWECESDCQTQQSPLKHRSRPAHRFSSLNSNAILSQEAPVVQKGLRRASDGLFPILCLEASGLCKPPALKKQENVPYSFNLPIRSLAQFDGTSDDGHDERSHDLSFKISPWSDATMDSPSKDSPPSNEANTLPKTPRTSNAATNYLEKRSDDSIDLTLPSICVLPDPFDLFTESSCPLTHTSPTKGVYPFLVEDRNTSSLSPLNLRSSASPLRPSQRHLAPISRSRSFTPSRRPDRFIAARRASQSPRESFQISKPADKLVGSERVLRTNSGAPDPFGRNVPRTPPRTTTRPRPSPSPPRTGSSGPHNVLGVRRAPVTSVGRQISNGAVWNVGGAGALGDSVAGVSDGQNGLLASGTNAPLYSSKFLARIDLTSELEIHERRLALALDLDPSSRILTHQTLDSSQQISPTNSNSSLSPDQGYRNAARSRVWMNNEWVREGSVARLFGFQILFSSGLLCAQAQRRSINGRKLCLLFHSDKSRRLNHRHVVNTIVQFWTHPHSEMISTALF